MTTNRVDIEVRLDGAEEAKKGLTGIGETASGMADRFDKSNSHLGEGLGSLVGNVEDAGGAFRDLSSTVKSLGTGGKASFLSLIPAIGGVVAVGYALYETFINISGAAQAAEDANEAAAAAAADLQAKLEALAEKGVEPTTKELEKFTRAQLMAQLAKEKMEKQTEKISRKLAKETKAQAELTDAIVNRNSMSRKLLTTLGFYNSVAEARIKLDKAKAASSRAITGALNDQRKAQKKLKDAEAQFIAFEERSPAFIAAKTKENLAILKTMQLQEAEIDLKGRQLEVDKLAIEEEHLNYTTRLKNAEALKKKTHEQLVAEHLSFGESKKMARLKALKDEERLVKLANEVQDRVRIRNADLLNEQVINKKRDDIESKRLEELRAAAKARQSQLQANKAKEILLEQRKQAEIFQIRDLSLQLAAAQGAESVDITEARYQLELEKAGDNANKRLAIDLKYEISRTQLAKSEAEKRDAEEKRLQEQRKAFILDSQAFDIEMMTDGIDKELSLLEMKYRRERELKEHSEEELTELSRRFALEREKIQKRSLVEFEENFKQLGLDMFSGLSTDLTKEVYKSLTDQTADEARRALNERVNEQIDAEKKALREFEGDNAQRIKATEDSNKRILELQKEFQASRNEISKQEKNRLPAAIGGVLVALGEQAAVESLIFGAKAIASLFTEPQLAANYGIASGIMATAAVTAGASGRALGAGASSGGGGGGGAPSFSPLGTPQTTAGENRERAETATTTFNINFDGAVVYDSRRAAELALTDRITTLQNQNRRGAPRRRS